MGLIENMLSKGLAYLSPGSSKPIVASDILFYSGTDVSLSEHKLYSPQTSIDFINHWNSLLLHDPKRDLPPANEINSQLQLTRLARLYTLLKQSPVGRYTQNMKTRLQVTGNDLIITYQEKNNSYSRMIATGAVDNRQYPEFNFFQIEQACIKSPESYNVIKNTYQYFSGDGFTFQMQQGVIPDNSVDMDIFSRYLENGTYLETLKYVKK